MNDYEKPPLGVKPATLHAEERAKELADAISRNILNDRFKECSTWVEELRVQIDLARTFYNPPVRIVGLRKLDEEEGEVEE